MVYKIKKHLLISYCRMLRTEHIFTGGRIGLFLRQVVFMAYLLLDIEFS